MPAWQRQSFLFELHLKNQINVHNIHHAFVVFSNPPVIVICVFGIKCFVMQKGLGKKMPEKNYYFINMQITTTTLLLLLLWLLLLLRGIIHFHINKFIVIFID